MSAARLREAAEALRLVAEDATPGPWTSFADGVVVGVAPNPQVADRVSSWNGPYIAAMAPPVAFALADWLEMEAYRAGIFDRDVDSPIKTELFANEFCDPLAVAGAILGDQP